MIWTVPYLKKFAFHLKISFTIFFLAQLINIKHKFAKVITYLLLLLLLHDGWCLIFGPTHSLGGGWGRRPLRLSKIYPPLSLISLLAVAPFLDVRR